MNASKHIRPRRLTSRLLAIMLPALIVLHAIAGIAAAAEDTVTGIAFDNPPSPAIVYVEDDTLSLSLNAAMSGAVSVKDVTSEATWTSSNSSIVKVDKGVLTGLSAGTATISATYKGFKQSISVTSAYRYDSVALTEDGDNADGEKNIALGQQLAYGLVGTNDDEDTDLTSKAAWTSSNTAVATVSGGSVTLISAGTATITGKYKGESASVKLNVYSPYQSMSITPDDDLLEMKVGDAAASLAASVVALEGGSSAVTADADWKSANTAVATVSKGIVTAVGAGTTTITASYLGVTDSITVIVRPSYEAMRITPKDNQYLSLKDDPISLKATVLDDPDHPLDVTASAAWTSSNLYTATVSDTGVVTPKGVGTAIIKAAYKGLSQQITVNVLPTFSSLAPAKDTIDGYIDEELSLPGITATSLTDDTMDVTSIVNWSSSDTSIIEKVNGKWIAKKVGTAVMKAQIQSKFASVTVNVHEKPLVLSTDQPNISLVIGKESSLPTITVTNISGTEEDVTDKVMWKSSTANLLLKAPKMKGLIASNVTLTATYLGKSLAIKVTIEEEITKLLSDTTSIVLSPGKSKSIKVTGVYKSGKTVSISSKMNWTLTPDSIASINGATIKGVAEGTGKLVGTYQGKSIEFTVSVKLRLMKLTISDKSFTLAPGQADAVQIIAQYEGGRTKDVTKTASITVSNSKIATYKDGTITGLAKGSTVIKASFEGKTATIRVSVK